MEVAWVNSEVSFDFLLKETEGMHRLYDRKAGWINLTDTRGNRYHINEKTSAKEVWAIIEKIKALDKWHQ